MREGFGVGMWKAIRKEWGLVSSRISYTVDNGQRVKFWKDKWCGNGLLCNSFPSLFSLASSKNAWVEDVWNSSILGERGWSPSFSRPLSDWEVGCAKRFLSCLEGMRAYRNEEDRVLWIENKNGRYTMKSFCMALESRTSISFPWSNIWKAWVHPRVSFFTWEATWGKVLTLDQVLKRGWSLANRCFLSC